MPLGTRIRQMPGTHTLDPIHDGRIPPSRRAEVGPVTPPPARDDVVDRSQRETAVIEVTMAHVA